jgi:hypothetical protein
LVDQPVILHASIEAPPFDDQGTCNAAADGRIPNMAIRLLEKNVRNHAVPEHGRGGHGDERVLMARQRKECFHLCCSSYDRRLARRSTLAVASFDASRKEEGTVTWEVHASCF